MDRGAWWAAAHTLQESDMTEVTEHAGTSERACLRVWGRIHLNDT